jgi:hypothetical protein|tara:strand:- start:242 stop:574 length:333 start_codon:yes stop_codon:yes gene_type:complete
MKLQEDKLVPVIVDLTKPGKEINESFLRQFGATVELIIKRMFGLNSIPFLVKGRQTAVDKFMNTMAKENEYMRHFQRLGLSNPSVINSKSKLNQSIAEFEKVTGIPWPLK